MCRQLLIAIADSYIGGSNPSPVTDLIEILMIVAPIADYKSPTKESNL